MTRHRLFAIVGIAISAIVPVATAGPKITEPEPPGASGFAPGLKAEKYCPTPTLRVITGTLGPVMDTDSIDLEDMYHFKIVCPTLFSASTRSTDCAPPEGEDGIICGMSTFDPQLWLFRYDGVDAYGLLANNDVSAINNAARITSPATDLSLAAILIPGEYLLAISAIGHVPTSAGGDIFNFVNPTEVSGPDGPGGLSAHTGWFGGDPTESLGTYTIILTGADGFTTGDVCPQTPCIPTVSEWGFVILTLLLLTAGKAAFRV